MNTVIPYRGRLAPSPTGLLHLGHARTFLTAAERACHASGTLILRSEDPDPQRSRPAFVAAMLEDLHWLGIDWSEGPDIGGPYAPYSQSERRPLYLAAWQTLVEAGFVYPCTCSRTQLRREAEESAAAPHEHPCEANESAPDDEPLYRGTCRPAPGPAQAPATPRGVNWRFRVPDGEAVSFIDNNLGPRTYTAGRHFGDFLIWRRDDVPSYQLAVTVDDAAMRITEVVRGADLLKSTARQILLYRALGLTQPDWFHCPLVTDADGRRLAKRTDALSIRALREQGEQQDRLRG